MVPSEFRGCLRIGHHQHELHPHRPERIGAGGDRTASFSDLYAHALPPHWPQPRSYLLALGVLPAISLYAESLSLSISFIVRSLRK